MSNLHDNLFKLKLKLKDSTIKETKEIKAYLDEIASMLNNNINTSEFEEDIMNEILYGPRSKY